MLTRWLLPCIAALCFSLFASSPAASSPDRFPDRYDAEIERAVRLWWPDFPLPALWKAQLNQESLLDPDAVSPVGARGLAQFMPGTWEDVRRAMGWGLVSPHDVRPAIEGGAFYMARLRKTWRAPRPALDRHWLAAASYNAGAGNLIKAQARCGGPALYAEIIACLPQVTGRHSAETITYVERIKKWWREMELGR